MNLEWTSEEEDFRQEARSWLEAHAAPVRGVSGNTREGFARLREWDRRLYDAGWSVPAWPAEFGGRDASLWEWLIFEEEYWRAGCPQRVAQQGIFLLAPTLFEFGTAEQKSRYLRATASGDMVWAQGWSEPDAGSDLAGVRSRADQVDGGWVLNGQKTWTTRGAFSDRLFGLFRSDPDASPHRGLSYLMVDLAAPGITVRPVRVLDGEEGFAEVYFDDVFVPDDDVIGRPHDGWKVAMSTASSERGLTLRSPGRFLATAERLLGVWKDQGDRADPTARDAVIRAWVDASAYQLFTLQAVTRLHDGGHLGPEASLMKLWWSELDVNLHDAALALLGDRAELDGPWMRGFEFALAGPIYAGTNEIQRNIVAQRVLRLPKGA